MEKSKLFALQKKRQAGLNNKMATLMGAVILIVLIVAVAPTLYESLGELNVTEITNLPAWVPTVMIIMVSAGLVFMVWKAIAN